MMHPTIHRQCGACRLRYNAAIESGQFDAARRGRAKNLCPACSAAIATGGHAAVQRRVAIVHDAAVRKEAERDARIDAMLFDSYNNQPTPEPGPEYTVLPDGRVRSRDGNAVTISELRGLAAEDQDAAAALLEVRRVLGRY